MKHESIIPSGNAAAGRLNDRTREEVKPAVDVETRIEEIHRQAESIGPLLEEILQIGHDRLKDNRTTKPDEQDSFAKNGQFF